MPTENLTLNLTTLHTLIRWRKAEPHPVLATTPAWYDQETTRALDRHALGELDRNGRLCRGRPDVYLDDLIGALVHPHREYYGWITTVVDGRSFRFGVLTVAAHQEAALAVRNYAADTIVLAAIPPSEVRSAFLTQLPVLAPASGQPVSVPYQEFLAATEPSADGFAGFGSRQSPGVGAINDVLRLPRTGGGSLYVAGRVGGAGPRRRGRRPVNYLDTTTGRWLTQLDTGAGGIVATLRPAGIDLLAAHLADLEWGLGRSE